MSDVFYSSTLDGDIAEAFQRRRKQFEDDNPGLKFDVHFVPCQYRVNMIKHLNSENRINDG